MPPQDTESSQGSESLRQNEIALAGLIAIGLIIMQDFFVLEDPDLAAWVSIASFAISIPLLASLAIVQPALDRWQGQSLPWYIGLLSVLAVLGAYVGTIAAFWHIRWWVGVLFGVASLFGLVSSTVMFSRIGWGSTTPPDATGTQT